MTDADDASDPLDHMRDAGHELVQFARDESAGLRAIVAIHSTRLGPAIGGVRMRPYRRENDALRDALRLSRGMTYKAAAAGVLLGGGKAVIIGESPSEKTPQLLVAFAAVVDRLSGRYLAAEDIGTDGRDIAVMRGVTPYTSDPDDNGAYYTALGTLLAIRACLAHTTDSDSLVDRHVAIQGVGRTGRELAQLVAAHGGRLTVADVEARRANATRSAFGARVVPPDEILSTECDLLAPCALGGAIGADTVGRLRCRAIAGTANNILGDNVSAELLRARGIAMVPDYVANAGGIIKVAADLDWLDDDEARERTARIFDTALGVLRAAASRGTTPQAEADQLAERNLERQAAGTGHFFDVTNGRAPEERSQ